MQGPPGVAGPRGSPVSINFTILTFYVFNLYTESLCLNIYLYNC